MTSSLAAGKTASIAIRTNTAHRPWRASRAVIAPSLAAEGERRREVHRADGTRRDHAGHVRADGGLREAVQRPVPAGALGPGRLLLRRQRPDDRAARRLDPEGHRGGARELEPRDEPG